MPSPTRDEILGAYFIPALEGLPLTEEEKPGTADVLRQKVVTILLDDMAANLAGNLAELMQRDDEDEAPEPPAEGDPAPVVEPPPPSI